MKIKQSHSKLTISIAILLAILSLVNQVNGELFSNSTSCQRCLYPGNFKSNAKWCLNTVNNNVTCQDTACASGLTQIANLFKCP